MDLGACFLLQRPQGILNALLCPAGTIPGSGQWAGGGLGAWVTLGLSRWVWGSDQRQDCAGGHSRGASRPALDLRGLGGN